MFAPLSFLSLFLSLCMVIVCHGGRSNTPGKTMVVTKVEDLTGDMDLFMKNIDAHNEEAMSILSGLLSSKDGWKFVNEKDGVSVERRQLPSGSFVDKVDRMKGGKHACVRSTGILNAPATEVFNLFIDNDRVSEYNEHCVKVHDVADVTKQGIGSRQWTKIAWACSPKYGPLKARDFSSVVHYNKYQNGTYVILNRPAYHSDTKPTNKYVRATILLAANVIEPLSQDSCRVTQIAHVNPGGVSDTPAVAWIINSLCAVGPPTFLRKLESAALRRVRPQGIGLSLPHVQLPKLNFKLTEISTGFLNKNKIGENRIFTFFRPPSNF